MLSLMLKSILKYFCGSGDLSLLQWKCLQQRHWLPSPMRVNMNLQHVELGWSAWGGEEVLANPRADGEALPEARPKVYLGSRPLDEPGNSPEKQDFHGLKQTCQQQLCQHCRKGCLEWINPKRQTRHDWNSGKLAQDVCHADPRGISRILNLEEVVDALGTTEQSIKSMIVHVGSVLAEPILSAIRMSATASQVENEKSDIKRRISRGREKRYQQYPRC